MTYTRTISLPMLFILAAGCVTVNVYFPAAAAEQAADRIIREIYGTQQPEKAPPPAQPDDQSSNEILLHESFAGRLLEFLIPGAQAQTANIDISSPAINRLKASMAQRHAQLQPHYDSGAIGMDNNGLITLHDARAVPIRDRNAVNQLISAENQDRNALYAEIARANGQPGWESQIRDTFARRWIANAPAGWYFRDTTGNWVQK